MLRVVRQVTVELIIPAKLDGEVAVGGQSQQQPGGAFEVGHHHVEGRGDIGGGGAIDGAAVQQGLHAPCGIAHGELRGRVGHAVAVDIDLITRQRQLRAREGVVVRQRDQGHAGHLRSQAVAVADAA